MQTLSHSQAEHATGGILWTTPAFVALADTASLGPLGLAFSVGYGAGTFIYNTWLSD